MARTKKVGIVGKYGTRYGSSIRKRILKIEIAQHARYTCQFCAKNTVKRVSIGIWRCRHCKITTAGGAYVPTTPISSAVRSTIRRLRDVGNAAGRT